MSSIQRSSRQKSLLFASAATVLFAANAAHAQQAADAGTAVEQVIVTGTRLTAACTCRPLNPAVGRRLADP